MKRLLLGSAAFASLLAIPFNRSQWSSTKAKTMSYVNSLIAMPALAIALAFAPGSSYAGPRDTPARSCAALVLPSTAVIQSKVLKKGDDGKVTQGTAVGSGFVIDSRGFIITNQHVIDGGQEFRLRLYGDKPDSWRAATVVWADENVDLAVLRVQADKPLPELELGPSSDLAVGEPAIVIGSPFGDEFSLSAGVVSKIQVPKPEDTSGIYLIQTDAAVNHGNSGGAMLNANCEAVGVVELKLGEAGIGFAITADRAARVAAGNMNAEWAGVTHGIRDVSLKIVASEGADRQHIIVRELAVGSPAAAVLQLGDYIVSIGGRAVRNRFDLERAFWDNKAGDAVKVHIERNGEPMDVVLTLAAAPADSAVKD